MDTLVEEVPTLEAARYAQEHGRLIGAGAYHEVYHVPGSKWVYKFECDDPIDEGTNRREVFNQKRLKGKLPEGVDVPEMVLLSENIMAAEYIEGVLAADVYHHWQDNQCACLSHGLVDCYSNLLRKMTIHIIDLHGRNVIVSRKRSKVFLIDMGEYGDGTY